MKDNGTDQRTLAICFGQFGPYHHARVAALQREVKDQKTKRLTAESARQREAKPRANQETRVVPVQIASATSTYAWSGPSGVAAPPQAEDLKTLCEGVEEAASPVEVFLKARKLFREEKVDVAFLPSYSPARYFALFAVAKSLGIRTVMMNESHAGTEQATGWKRWIKRQIVKQFDAALVGGEPHKRHFASLGIPADKIFTGYDAVDGDFFASRADEIRAAAKKSFQFSVFSVQQEEKADEVRKKSDESARHEPVALVFVGSGELEGLLREQARSLGLRVVERTDWRVEKTGHGLTRINTDKPERLAADRTEGNAASPVTRAGCEGLQSQAEPRLCETGLSQNCKPNTENSVESDRGAVYFYGFRQIEENPVFYALAEAFMLPSLKEEWGLVVNEAMACSLPVIVSRTAGCAEDLLPGSESWQCSVGSIRSGENANAGDCKLKTENSLERRSNGFVFDPKSSDALSEALKRVADQKTDGLTQMGKRSREIVAKFSCENFARQALRAAEAASA